MSKANGKALTRAELDQIDDLQQKRVRVPQWKNREVILREPPSNEAIEFWLRTEKKRADGNLPADFVAELVAKCLVDEDGNRLYPDDQVEKLAARSSGVLNFLYGEVLELTSLSDESIGQAVKNSASGKSNTSSTDSPAT